MSSKIFLDQEIDLPLGVSFKGQEKKHKFLPKSFSSIFKSKNNKAVKATKKNQRFSQEFDSEKTVARNDLTYINRILITDDESQRTLYSIYNEDNIRDPNQAFLKKKGINLKGRYQDTVPVLTKDLAKTISNRLPGRLKEATIWKLLYSVNQHGAILNTLYYNIKNHGPCVMVLKSSEDEIFGAFISEPFDPNNNNEFFGTPECFLWKADEYQFKKYTATNVNQCFMHAEPDYIAMGSANKGKFGFFLDKYLDEGHSSVCDTFDNEILTKNNKFVCHGCEIWGLEYE